jgi:hypothetical protein
MYDAKLRVSSRLHRARSVEFSDWIAKIDRTIPIEEIVHRQELLFSKQ